MSILGKQTLVQLRDYFVYLFFFQIRDEGDVEMMQEKTRKVDRLSNGKRGNRMQKINKRNKVSSKDDREKQAEARYRGKLDLQCESKNITCYNKSIYYRCNVDGTYNEGLLKRKA